MLNISEDIHSLSHFKRNTAVFLRRLRETSRPIVLTVNGRAELIVQDVASYQRLLELIDRLEALAGSTGLEQTKSSAQQLEEKL